MKRLAIIFLIVLWPAVAAATSYVWNGSGSSLSTNTCWTPTGNPGTSDTISISSTAAMPSSGACSCSSGTLNSGAISGGTITVANGTFYVASAGTISGGAVASSGTTILSNSGTLGAFTSSAGTLNNFGTISGAATINNVLSNYGVISGAISQTANGSASMFNQSGGSVSNGNYLAIFTNYSGGTVSSTNAVHATVNNYGVWTSNGFSSFTGTSQLLYRTLRRNGHDGVLQPGEQRDAQHAQRHSCGQHDNE